MSENAAKGIKIAVIVVVSAVIGIFFGTLMSNFELRFMFSREYLGEVNGVEVYVVGDIDRENFVQHLKMLANAPAKLAECCERMYFTGAGISLPAGDSALGLTQGSTVYVSTTDYSTYVVYHELFHAYDNAHGLISENSIEFFRAYRDNESKIPIFAQNESMYQSEYFAQAGAMFLIMPLELSYVAPETYKFYNETLGFGENVT